VRLPLFYGRVNNAAGDPRRGTAAGAAGNRVNHNWPCPPLLKTGVIVNRRGSHSAQPFETWAVPSFSDDQGKNQECLLPGAEGRACGPWRLIMGGPLILKSGGIALCHLVDVDGMLTRGKLLDVQYNLDARCGRGGKA